MSGKAEILRLLGLEIVETGINLELFRADQIRMKRRMFAKDGGEEMKCFPLHPIRRFKGRGLGH